MLNETKDYADLRGQVLTLESLLAAMTDFVDYSTRPMFPTAWYLSTRQWAALQNPPRRKRAKIRMVL